MRRGALAVTAMISGMDTADEQYVAVTDPTTNQEVMVPVSHTNLGPFESLLAATEAADTHAEENVEGMNARNRNPFEMQIHRISSVAVLCVSKRKTDKTLADDA